MWRLKPRELKSHIDSAMNIFAPANHCFSRVLSLCLTRTQLFGAHRCTSKISHRCQKQAPQVFKQKSGVSEDEERLSFNNDYFLNDLENDQEIEYEDDDLS